MKRQGRVIHQQWKGLLTVLDPDDLQLGVDPRPASHKFSVNLRQFILSILVIGLVSCAPAKPPATPSPSVETTPIVTPTPSATPSVSPSPKPSARSSQDSSSQNALPTENRSEPQESNDAGSSVEEAPAPKTKAIEAPVEKPQRSEKPAPVVEPEAPARVPQPSDLAPDPPAAPKPPKAPASPVQQSDDPEPPALPAP